MQTLSVKLICEPTEVIRIYPQNFRKSDEKIFFHEFRKQIKSLIFFQFASVIIKGNGSVIKKRKENYPTEFHTYNSIITVRSFYYYKHIVKQLLLRKLKFITRPSILVFDIWSFGYFHWMAEVLPRLISCIDEIKDLPVILPVSYQSLPFVTESLSLIGLYPHYLDVGCTYLFKRILFPSHFCGTGNYNDEAIKKTRTFVRKLNSMSVNPCKRIYISRRRASKRRIINESEILPILEKYAFQIIFTEDLSVSQQIEVFSNTSILLTNHGAGLTNMLFMEENTTVIELRHKLDNQNNCYFSLASALNLKYYYQLCEPMTMDDSYHFADLNVNKFELDKLIDQLIK